MGKSAAWIYRWHCSLRHDQRHRRTPVTRAGRIGRIALETIRLPRRQTRKQRRRRRALHHTQVRLRIGSQKAAPVIDLGTERHQLHHYRAGIRTCADALQHRSGQDRRRRARALLHGKPAADEDRLVILSIGLHIRRQGAHTHAQLTALRIASRRQRRAAIGRRHDSVLEFRVQRDHFSDAGIRGRIIRISRESGRDRVHFND